MEAIGQDLWSESGLPAQVVMLRLFGGALLCALIGVERE
jgi:uncharacterized membrane protein YhiD involved in acid resistance